MAEIVERLARLEQQQQHHGEKIGGMANDVASIARSVSAIEITLAKESGVRSAVRYLITIATGLCGVFAGAKLKGG